VGVRAGALANLNNKRGFAIDAALEQTHGLFKVIDVVRSNGILAISSFEEFLSRNDHGVILLVK
jgi:hypothetical protein